MKKTNPKSRIEIWGDNYINNPDKRQSDDQELIILQCESNPNKSDYIVEIIQPEDYEDELELIKSLNDDCKRLVCENTHLYESLGKRNTEISHLIAHLQELGVAESDCERIRKGEVIELYTNFRPEVTD